jgi:HK97 family phage major capsid protein
MANVISTRLQDGTILLPSQVADELFNMVKGHSSLARLKAESPIAFNGTTEMTFTLDKEADIVGENGAKSNGGATVGSVTIRPIKMEYGTRVSDEFMYATDEYRLNVLRAFAEGAARKFARGFDIAAMHGTNPRTGEPSAVVGDNNFDAQVSNTVVYDATAPDANVNAALALIDAGDAVANGLALSPAMRSAIAQMQGTNGAKYPEFNWGSTPATLGQMNLDTNSTVAVGDVDHALVGDFTGFKWGYAKDIPVEVISYGNPDNDAQAGDLKGHNQVYLRAEAYIGWGILAPTYFARITNE